MSPLPIWGFIFVYIYIQGQYSFEFYSRVPMPTILLHGVAAYSFRISGFLCAVELYVVELSQLFLCVLCVLLLQDSRVPRSAQVRMLVLQTLNASSEL